MSRYIGFLYLCSLLSTIGVNGNNLDISACTWDVSLYTEDYVYSSEEEELYKIPRDIPSSTIHLDLGYKKISELDQQSFVHLRNLKTLDLRGNYIQDIGGVLSALSELRFLELSQNHITELSNASFRGLSHLQCLILLQNNISRFSNDTFRGLIGLTGINLRSNPLRSVDGVFTTNQNLSSLDLNDCQLKSFPKDLPKSIRHLVLDHNRISSIQMSHVGHLTNLQTLSVSSNDLTHIAGEAFLGLASLAELTLSENRLTFVPDISNFVLKLYLDSNEIQSLALEDFASRISERRAPEKQSTKTSTTLNNGNEMHLLILDLKGNKIERLGNKVFSSFKNLTKLTLDNNPVSFIEKDLFKNNGNLNELSLNNIPVKNFDAKHIFKYLRKLGTLNLKSSRQMARSVMDIKFKLKETLPKLKNLDLSFNNMNVFSCQQIFELGMLTRVNLRNNPLHCGRGDHVACLKSHLNAMSPFVSWDSLECVCPIDLRGVRVVDVDLNDDRAKMHFEKTTHKNLSEIRSNASAISELQFVMVAILNILIAFFI